MNKFDKKPTHQILIYTLCIFFSLSCHYFTNDDNRNDENVSDVNDEDTNEEEKEENTDIDDGTGDSVDDANEPTDDDGNNEQESYDDAESQTDGDNELESNDENNSDDNNQSNHSDDENHVLFRIPVVVHVVHSGQAIGDGPNISFAQILSQIEVLNEDFRKIPGTRGFNDNPNGADTSIEFYLAELGPDGEELEEPGVNRVDGGWPVWPRGPIGNPIDTILKPDTQWDPERYFNIWVVNFGGFVGRNLLGYAQFPSESGLEGLEIEEGNASTDGIVIGYKYFGRSENGEFPDLVAPYNLGRTTTHEVGHWLGLRHVWGDGDCEADDFCTDTPLAAEANYDCTSNSSCGSPDMIENFMDYSNDACMNTFTIEQMERMHTVLTTSPRRMELVQ